MRNPHFRQNQSSAQEMYESIVIQALKIYGQETYYLPREIVNRDVILNEDIQSRFEEAYPLEMYIENVEGFDGEGDLFTKFGVEIRDEATFVVARRRFGQVVASEEEFTRPREGDLIYLGMTGSIFEIMRVENDNPFYQLQNLPVYKMYCEKFEASGEDFDVDNIADLDQYIEQDHYRLDITVADSGKDNIIIGEEVYQLVDSENGDRVTAEVVDWDASKNVLSLVHVGTPDGYFRQFGSGLIYMSESGAIKRVVSESNISEDLAGVGEQNDDFVDEMDGILVDGNNIFGNL